MSDYLSYEYDLIKNPVIHIGDNVYLCLMWLVPEHEHVHRWVFKVTDDGTAGQVAISDDFEEVELVYKIWNHILNTGMPEGIIEKC